MRILVLCTLLVWMSTSVESTTLNPVPSEEKPGDVVLGLNVFAGYGLILAPFLEAIWAWEQRLLVNDSSPGAVTSASPPTFSVGWDLKDDGADPGLGLKNSVNNSLLRTPRVNAQVGLYGSSVTLPAAQLGHQTEDVIMGFMVGVSELSDKSKYGYFLRTCAPTSLDAAALLALLAKLQVKQTIIVFMDDPYQQDFFQFMQDGSGAALAMHAGRLGKNTSLWGPVLQGLVDRRERYIVAPAPSSEFGFWKAVLDIGLISPDRQWFGLTTMVTDARNNHEPWFGAIGVKAQNHGKLFGKWMDWVSTLSFDSFPVFFSARPGFALSQNMLKYKVNTFYDPYLVDGTFALLFAIERLHAAGVAPADCRGAKLLAELRKTKFEGVSGLVQFRENGDRAARYDVWNIANRGVGTGLEMVAIRGTWEESEGLTIGGWEGSLESPDWTPLIFSNGSTTPLASVVTGCPKGERYLGFREGCGPCSLGTFNPTDGNIKDTCLPCEGGLHAPVVALSVCTVCPLGTYQNGTGSSECMPCSAGWFADGVARTSCEICPRGTFSEMGASICTSCELGAFSSQQGSTSCTSCAAGFTTEFVGSRGEEACACPANSLFIPGTDPAAGGSCFRCNSPADKDKYSDGISCLGGRTCEALIDHTISSSFPCPEVSNCADENGCKEQCMVPVSSAREVCESFEYHTMCEGWTVKSSAPLHNDYIYAGSRTGWQNVALLGRIAPDAAHASSYGIHASGFSLIPKRSMCSPVAVSDPAAMILSHPKHQVGSFLQPPLVKAGYYMLDLRAARTAGLPNSVDGRASDGSAMVPNTMAPERQSVGVAQPWRNEWFQLLPISKDSPSSQAPDVVPLFKCASPSVCSGGHVGQCFPGQTGLGCALCAKNFYSSSTTGCTHCTGGSLAGIIVAVFVVVAVLVLILLYKMTLNPLASQLTARMTTGLALGLTFNGLQSFGVISLMSIDFGEPLESLLASLRVFLFDMDQLQWECVMEVTPMGKMGARLIVPPFICAIYVILFCLSHMLRRFKVAPWTVPHTINCTGMVLQVLFISICMAVIMPYKCTPHPVAGITTLVDIPHQVCGVKDQLPMAVVGGVFIFLYPILGLTVCTYVIYILPDRTAKDPTFLNGWKFLVSRFRFDRYYFGVLFMLRNLGVALVPVVNPSNPMLQQAVMAAILLVSVVLQAILWPWAAQEINYLDLACLLSMMMTVVMSAGMIDSKTVDPSMMRIASAGAVSVALVVMAAVVCASGVKFIAETCHKSGRCLKASKRISGVHKEKEVDDMALAVKHVTEILHSWTRRNVSALITILPAYDRATLSKAVAMLLGVIDVHPSLLSDVERKSGTGPLRITVQRFKRRSSLQMDDDEEGAPTTASTNNAERHSESHTAEKTGDDDDILSVNV